MKVVPFCFIAFALFFGESKAHDGFGPVSMGDYVPQGIALELEDLSV